MYIIITTTTGTSVLWPFPQAKLGQPIPRVLLTYSRIETIRISGKGFFMGQMSFLTPNHKCQSTDSFNTDGWVTHKHKAPSLTPWSGLILSSSTTRLLMKAALLPLRELSRMPVPRVYCCCYHHHYHHHKAKTATVLQKVPTTAGHSCLRGGVLGVKGIFH